MNRSAVDLPNDGIDQNCDGRHLTVGAGELQVTLLYNNDNDQDLHVVEPSGRESWDASRGSTATGGRLDRDDNVNMRCRDAEPGGVRNRRGADRRRPGQDGDRSGFRIPLVPVLATTVRRAVGRGTPLLAVGCLAGWLLWAFAVRWISQRQCILAGLDDQKASNARAMTECSPSSWWNPLSGTPWTWPPSWQAGWLVMGGLVLAGLYWAVQRRATTSPDARS